MRSAGPLGGADAGIVSAKAAKATTKKKKKKKEDRWPERNDFARAKGDASRENVSQATHLVSASRRAAQLHLWKSRSARQQRNRKEVVNAERGH